MSRLKPTSYIFYFESACTHEPTDKKRKNGKQQSKYADRRCKIAHKKETCTYKERANVGKERRRKESSDQRSEKRREENESPTTLRFLSQAFVAPNATLYLPPLTTLPRLLKEREVKKGRERERKEKGERDGNE